MATTRIKIERTYLARVNQEWNVDVPSEMLADPQYFDESGYPTSDFDDWMTSQDDADSDETEPLDDWQLELRVVKGVSA